jgi:prepilin-type N-terminal cleavage/methylation domain-containing protein
MNKMEKGFSLVEIVIVIGIIGILGAVTVVALRPQELFANGRNARRVNDVAGINTAIGQWLSREGVHLSDPFGASGLGVTDNTALTPADGSITDEGAPASEITAITDEGYIGTVPVDPFNSEEYRVGVDNVTTPDRILVCTDEIEITRSYPESEYPNGIFCQMN